MRNIYQQFLQLRPTPPLQVGVITQIVNDIATIKLPDNGRINARGSGTVGQTVFVRDGVIEGAAPSLTIVEIEI